MANYLYIAILLVCFYDALIMLLIPSSATFLLAEDGVSGLMVSSLSALTIGLYALWSVGYKKLSNIWMAFLLLFIVFSSFHSPSIVFDSVFLPKDPGIFNFKPMFQALIYLLMFMGICSLNITERTRSYINNTFVWVGIVYAVCIILQHLGMDQFYKLINEDVSHLSRHPQDGGFISQPVFAAALLSICFPFVFRYKNWVFNIIILIAVFLTGNRSALAAIAISSVYLLTHNKRYALTIFVAYAAILALIVGIVWACPHFNFPMYIDDRPATWIAVIQDFIHPHFPGIHKSYIFTGLGFGIFSISFPFFHNSPFFQAHNEYLELTYGLSFIGLFLFIKMQWHIFKTVSAYYLGASLLAISVFALTNPVWHIPQLQFLTVFLVALAYNKESEYVGKVNQY